MGENLRTALRQGRRAVLAGLRAFGGTRWIAASAWRRRRLLILCYHGVSMQCEHEWRPELFVTPDFLRRRFEILRDTGCVVLPLAKGIQRLRLGSLPPRSVVLTFDDGFYNFYAAAMPLLEEFHYPATVYLSTYYCVQQRPILRLSLDYLLWRARFQVLPPDTFAGQTEVADLQDSRQREKLVTILLDQAGAFSRDRNEQNLWLHGVAERIRIDWEDVVRSRILHLMTRAEVADIAGRDFDVQLHTHRHRAPRNESAFHYEILENRRIIEQLTGYPATHFCYPSGETAPHFPFWLRDLGVETATTCSVGLVRSDHDPLLLPRYVDTMAQSEALFEGWLSGAAEMLSWSRA